MKNLSRFIAGLLIFSLCIGMIPYHDVLPVSTASAEVFSGQVEGWTYYFDDETGTLVIIGKGPMPSFKDAPAPWSVYADRVTKVVCDDGITSISENAFAYFPKLENVTLPATLEAIDPAAFIGCNEMKAVEFAGNPEKLQEIIEKNDVAILAEIPVSAVSTTSIESLIGNVVEKTNPETPSVYESYVNAAGRVARDTSIDDSAGETVIPEKVDEPEPEIVSSDDQSAPVEEGKVEFKYSSAEDGTVFVDKYINGKLVYSESVSEDSSPEYTFYEYDGDNLIRERRVGYSVESCIDYVYENGKVVKILKSDSSNWKTETTISYNGNRRTETQINSNGYKTVVQFEDDREISLERYNRFGVQCEKSTTTIGERTSTKESIFCDSNGNPVTSETIVFTYDEKQNVVSEKCTSNNSQSGNIFEYEYRYLYDNNGLVTEENYYQNEGENGELVLRRQTKSQYDENGNCIENSNYSFDSESGEFVLSSQNKYKYDGNVLTSYEYHDYYGETYSEQVNFTYDGEKVVSFSKTVDIDTTSPSVTITDFTYENSFVSRIQSQGKDTSEVAELVRTDGVLNSYRYSLVANGETVKKLETDYVDSHLSSQTKTFYVMGEVSSQNKTSLIHNSNGNVIASKEESHDGTSLYVTESTYDGNKTITYKKYENAGKVNYEVTTVSANGLMQSNMRVDYENDGARSVSYNEYNSEGKSTSITSEYYDRYSQKKHSEVTTFAYDENGHQTVREEISYDGAGVVVSSNKSEYTYDENGYPATSQTTYYEKTEKYRTDFSEFSYDDAGREVLSKYTLRDANGNVTGSGEHETYYDENGNRTGSRNLSVSYFTDSYHSKYEHECVYNENNEIVSDRGTYYSGDEEDYSWVNTYTYDEYGNKIKEVRAQYDSSDNPISSTVYTYEGSSTKTVNYDAEGKVTSAWKEGPIFNEQGLQIGYTRTEYDADEKEESSERTEYLLDAYGNKVGEKRTRSDSNGTSTTLDEYIFDSRGFWIASKETVSQADGTTHVSVPRFNDEGTLIGSVSTIYNADNIIRDYTVYELKGNSSVIVHTEYVRIEEGSSRDVRDYTYDENGNRISEIYRFIDQNNVETVVSETVYEYEYGNQVGSVTSHYENGLLTSTTKTEEIIDESGNSIGVRDINRNASGEITSVSEYENVSDCEVRQTYYKSINSDGSYTETRYQYDESGYHIGYKSTYYDANEVETGYALFGVNGDSSLLAYTEYVEPGANTKRVIHYNYDETGNYVSEEQKVLGQNNTVISVTQYLEYNGERRETYTRVITDSNGAYKETNYQYDGYGKELSHTDTYSDPNGNPISSYRYEILFDESGNQIGHRDTYLDKDGNVTNSEEHYDNQTASPLLMTTANAPLSAASLAGQMQTRGVTEINNLGYTLYDAPRTMKVDKSDVAVRKGPDTSSETVDRVDKGEMLIVKGVTEDGWYVLENGSYVKGDCLAEVSITNYETPVTMYVSSADVAVRKTPDKSDNVVNRLQVDEQVKVVSITSDGWYKLENGTYIAADCVSDQPKPKTSGGSSTKSKTTEENVLTMFEVPVQLKVAAEKTELRYGAGFDCTVYETVQEGTPLVATGKIGNDWYMLDSSFYVYAHDVEVNSGRNSDVVVQTDNPETDEQPTSPEVSVTNENSSETGSSSPEQPASSTEGTGQGDNDGLAA